MVTRVAAFTIQRGVVTTKLDQIERGLDDIAVELRSLRSDMYQMERRVSFLEGRQKGGHE